MKGCLWRQRQPFFIDFFELNVFLCSTAFNANDIHLRSSKQEEKDRAKTA